MASKKKVEKTEKIIENEPVIIEEEAVIAPEEVTELKTEDVMEVEAPEVIVEKAPEEKKKGEKAPKQDKKIAKTPKYAVGSIVFVSKEAEADLNGFKLFPPYKKYTYTVEAYDADRDVYSLRRLNLSLKLKEADIVAPGERAHDPLNRRQF